MARTIASIFRSLTVVLILMTVGASTASAAPETVENRDQTFVRHGETTFRWTVFKVYDASFYLGGEVTESADPLGDVPKRLELEYNVSIEAEDFVESGTRLLRQNLSEEEWAAIEEDLDTINRAYRDVDSGDRYSLTYIPGRGTYLDLNGTELTHIENPHFGLYYFRIWLGDEPIRDRARDQLLGKR